MIWSDEARSRFRVKVGFRFRVKDGFRFRVKVGFKVGISLRVRRAD